MNNKINIHRLTKTQLAATIPLLYMISNLPVAIEHNNYNYCRECMSHLYGDYVYINSARPFSLCNHCYIIYHLNKEIKGGTPMRVESGTTQLEVLHYGAIERMVLSCTVTDIGDKFCILENPDDGEHIVLADSSYGKYPHFHPPFDSLGLPIISRFGVIIF